MFLRGRDCLPCLRRPQHQHVVECVRHLGTGDARQAPRSSRSPSRSRSQPRPQDCHSPPQAGAGAAQASRHAQTHAQKQRRQRVGDRQTREEEEEDDVARRLCAPLASQEQLRDSPLLLLSLPEPRLVRRVLQVTGAGWRVLLSDAGECCPLRPKVCYSSNIVDASGQVLPGFAVVLWLCTRQRSSGRNAPEREVDPATPDGRGHSWTPPRRGSKCPAVSPPKS